MDQLACTRLKEVQGCIATVIYSYLAQVSWNRVELLPLWIWHDLPVAAFRLHPHPGHVDL